MPRRFVAIVAVPFVIAACTEPPTPDAETLPATADQLMKLDQVIERYPTLSELADKARADGSVTEGEIIAIFEAAVALKGKQEQQEQQEQPQGD